MTVAPPPPSAWAPPSAPRPAQRRRGWALTGSIVLALLCALLAMSAGGLHGAAESTFPAPVKLLATVGALVMIGVSVLLIWRHRFPVLVATLAIAGAIVLPTTSLPALIALAAVSAVVTGWRLWTFIAGAYAAVAVSLCWDVATHGSLLAGFIGDPAEGTPERLVLFWAVPVLAAIAVAPFAGFGVARRLRAERDAAARGTAAANRNVAVLHREVERERERQELARELHDTLAARLSALSLHAGALELSAGEADQRTADAARVVRETAQGSLDELRNVVHVLRHPAGADAGASTGIVDIGALIDGALRDGVDVRAQLLVNDPTACDPRVAHACYRIVQESLSNVRRHAPGTPIRVEVRGGPESGVSITATNWLTPAAPPTSVGGGNGLEGMSERVALVGGSFQAGATPEGAFVVMAWMPWAPAP